MGYEQFPAETQKVRKSAPRARIELMCEVRQGVRPWKLVRLTDLSETGFRIAWMPEYDAAQPLRVRIPGMQVLSARICWHEGRQLGCAFASPLHVAVFEHMIRAAGGESG